MQRHRFLLIAIALGVLTSIVILMSRWSIEARYRTVEVILDSADWEALAAREGKDPVAVLMQARARGATSVGILERTLKRLAEQGSVAYLSTGDLLAGMASGALAPAFQDAPRSGKILPRAVYIAGTPAVLDFLEEAYRGLLGTARVSRVGRVLRVAGTREDIEELGVGFLAADLARYTSIGMIPVLRLRNYDGLTRQGLEDLFARLRRIGTGYTVVFELQEVLGADDLVDEAAKGMLALGHRYGRIEVFNVKRRQRGEDVLTQRMRPQVIRLFSLAPDELLQLTPEEARDKFVLAARERNARLLYLRPLVARAGVSGTEANLTYLTEITAELRRFGLHIGRAEPLRPLNVPVGLLLTVSLGAFATLGLVVTLLGERLGVLVPPRLVWGGIAAGVLATFGLVVIGHATLWRKLLALGIAATVPAVAIDATLPHVRSGEVIWTSLRALWTASILSVAAGVAVAAILSQWEFMMGAQYFLGVKIAHVIPAVLVVLLLWRRDRPRRPWQETVRELWEWSARPLALWHAILVVTAALAVGILLGRSGNLGLPVLGAEARLRTVTEDLLVARPRTKEYLIGHPALVLAAAVAVVGWRPGVRPLAAVGAIGQAGIVNSFSHIHTPLLYALWRTVNALLLGSILGALSVVLVLAVGAWYRRRFPRGP